MLYYILFYTYIKPLKEDVLFFLLQIAILLVFFKKKNFSLKATLNS